MQFYHVLNRGVEKRNIVEDDGDRVRFVTSLFTFNDRAPTPNVVTQSAQWHDVTRTRDPLVHLHAWCLMDNHYHLLLSPVADSRENLFLFMKKLNTGYAMFFNEKYKRSGYLWQGRYKRKEVSNDAYFNWLPYYIHLNPLDFSYPEWRSGNVTDCQKALKWLTSYRWSRSLDYIGISNFPALVNRHCRTTIH